MVRLPPDVSEALNRYIDSLKPLKVFKGSIVVSAVAQMLERKGFYQPSECPTASRPPRESE